ncbi:hypothetical protein GPALN_010187 [Globodera pallida]|nr:hypothetical protein GPALN_010187 [Globodera pallida]
MSGVVLLTFYVIFELISVPCIVILAQKNNRRESCFKMLLFMGLLNMVNINSSCLVIGIYAIRGDGFCDRPLFNYILGMIEYAFFTCESTIAVVLALNRCIAMANNRLAVALFDGHKLSIWFSVVVVYAFCSGFLFIPALPNGMLVAYFWQPHIGYVEDTEGWYVHKLYLYHSFLIGFGIPIIYAIFYFIIWKKSMRNVGVEQGGQQSCSVDQKRNQKIFVQVLLTSLMTKTFALLYLYMQYFPVPPWFVIAAHFSWACSHALSQQSPNLSCLDFDNTCAWHNCQTPPAPLMWFRSTANISTDQIMMTTGTNVVPNGSYAIVATNISVSQYACLISDVVSSQPNNGSLTFNYWSSPFVLLKVCRKIDGIPLNRTTMCQPTPFVQGPGPANITILASTNPFQVGKYFLFNYCFAIIDNIKYNNGSVANATISAVNTTTSTNSTVTTGNSTVTGGNLSLPQPNLAGTMNGTLATASNNQSTLNSSGNTSPQGSSSSSAPITSSSSTG